MTAVVKFFALWAFSFGLGLSAAAQPLPHLVYVWQRAWTPPVRQAVAAHGTNFAEVVVLTAEVSWKKSVPQTTRVAVDYPALLKTGRPIGLALRVGALPRLSEHAGFLGDLAATLVAEAQTNGVAPVELQLDCDCAASRLADYAVLVEKLQARLAPLPVTITALPSWLDTPAFAPLAARATNYVLQVHSLEQPTRRDAPFTLCDPAAARRAVARAGELGVPFRVALPTYGYMVAFNAAGKFIGLAAEAPRAGWPAGTELREVNADPLALASLVQGWTTNRPAALREIIWYRLPVAVDNLNWRWPTLGAIIAGRSPHGSLRAAARRVEPGLVEISLVNDGELDHPSPKSVVVRWTEARLVAGDGQRGYELAVPSATAAKFQTRSSSGRLPAGETQTIGWLRFDHECEVQVELEKN